MTSHDHPRTAQQTATATATPTATPTPESPPIASGDEVGYRGPERRQNVVDTRAHGTGLERRRGVGRRRDDFSKSAEEGEMTPEQFLFIKAIDAYKRMNGRPFPTWTEVLEVVRKLGYRKTAAMTLDVDGADDWVEPGDAPAFAPAPFKLPEREADAA